MERYTIGQRIAITFIIVFAILMALALYGYLTGGWENANAAPSREIALCSDDPNINDEINKIAVRALESALEKKIASLFDVWMRDDTGQPARAATGVKSAAVAYVHARTAILEWNIPRCSRSTP